MTFSEPGLPDSLTVDALLQLAVEVAQACGWLIVHERPARLRVAATKSSRSDIVTVMDSRSEQLAKTMLQARRPHDGIVGEEGAARPSASGITWVVDPIDGTVNYLYEIPSYCVSVAAVLGDPTVPGQWHPIVGAVYNPISEELFAARDGAPATMSDRLGQRTLQIFPHDDLSMALVGTGFGYRPEQRAAQGKVVAKLLPQVRDIRRCGSAALDLCAVAAGRLDCYYETGLNSWDMAAGWLIVQQAGGVVTGGELDYPSKDELTLAGPAGLVRQLRCLVGG